MKNSQSRRRRSHILGARPPATIMLTALFLYATKVGAQDTAKELPTAKHWVLLGES